MRELALAYKRPFGVTGGDTPEERVRELLVGNSDEAARAINGLEATLSRADVPLHTQILSADFGYQHDELQQPCLLGAELAFARDPAAVHGWSDDLVQSLVAFRLTDYRHEAVEWCSPLFQQRPKIISELLIAYASQCLLRRDESSIGLGLLVREASIRTGATRDSAAATRFPQASAAPSAAPVELRVASGSAATPSCR